VENHKPRDGLAPCKRFGLPLAPTAKQLLEKTRRSLCAVSGANQSGSAAKNVKSLTGKRDISLTVAERSDWMKRLPTR
jgi:hypothetical protein